MQIREAYGFLLGLSTGVTLLTTTSYRRVSPAWLKWLLIISGMLLIVHELTLTLLISSISIDHLWALRFIWYLMPMALLFPGVMAIDQLLRHPAMSPNMLLRWLAPFLGADLLIISLARLTVAPNLVVGWMPVLERGWAMLSLLLHEALLLAAVVGCFFLIRKPLPRAMRQALCGLVVGFAALGLAVVFLLTQKWLSLLLSELPMLFALWYAYETSTELQRTGG